jgi:hypothetical protein
VQLKVKFAEVESQPMQDSQETAFSGNDVSWLFVLLFV